MSAFICSDEHIAACARAASEALGINVDKIFREFKRENYRSVNYRYNEQSRPRFPKVEIIKELEVSPTQAIKLLQCMDYQSCEHPGWQASKARLYILATLGHLVDSSSMPGMESARWSI